MNLHQLVYLRNELEKALHTSTIKNELQSNCTRLQNLVEGIEADLQTQILDISTEHLKINEMLDNSVAEITNAVQLVQSKVDTLASKFFEENYKLEVTDAATVRSVRQISSDDTFESNLIQRINLMSNWQYPGLEIGCRDGEWTKYLVASDPLYIADMSEEFLTSAVQQFPELYQGRVRKYLIKDYCYINNLPLNQFGLIFSYNFFNYLSLDSIKQLLIQSFEWLRPGGKIMFTYNNADLPAAAAYAENYFMTYVPKSILQPMAESLGFETVFSFDSEPAHSIIEFKKPGELMSIKLGQTAGMINLKN
jgi:hypothetical protein